MPIIDGVEEELAVIKRAATGHDSLHIDNIIGDTTVKSLATGLTTANIAHLACHGVQDTDDALQSGFCLGDGKLTVSKLMDLKLDNSFLAFLSACETATGDSRQPDQVIHLAAAMLFAGFKSVVATMWYVISSFALSCHDHVQNLAGLCMILMDPKLLDVSMKTYSVDK